MLAFLLFACPKPPPVVAAPPPADVLVLSPTHGISIRDGVVAAVVPRDRAESFVGDGTQVIEGDDVSAGIVDAHAHPAGLGRSLDIHDLTGTTSYAETLDRIAKAPGNDWIVGRGWDQNDWSDAPEGGWPLAADLDERVGDRPVALSRVDGHALWVNTAALKAGGVTADTPDPEGGRIVRGAGGAPAGVLVDTAMGLVRAPAASDATRRRRLNLALQHIVERGLVGVHAMGVSDQTLALYEELAASGELPIRIWVYLQPGSDAALRLLEQGPWGEGRLKVVGIKAFADGALGSRGALLSEDYSDEPGHRGTAILDEAALTELAEACLAVRASLAVHAIGDQAVNNALDAFEVAREKYPDAIGVPLRVEHAQVVHPDDQIRFAMLNVTASMQPTHATSDMPWAEARLGPERVKWAYAWRTLADMQAPMAFGSDFPVEKVDPGLGLWAATHRSDPQTGEPVEGWFVDQALPHDLALAAFTIGAAKAVGERERGAIDLGRAADLTVWKVEPQFGGSRFRAVATIVDGAVAWSSAPAPDAGSTDAAPEPPPSPDR